MLEEVKAVETTETAAPQTGVETTGTEAPTVPTSAELDLATELEAVRKERDNYKQGMLKAKGKLPEQETGVPLEKLDEIVSSKVQEILSSNRDAELEAREKSVVEKILKENRELKVAMQNRSQLSVGSGAGAGTSPSMSPTSDNFFSAEQLADLKRRNIDPEKVKQNILRNRR